MYKVSFFFLLLFSLLGTDAQNTDINENPLAFKYLLKHFGLKGKVKKVTTFGSNNYLMTEDLFDTDGKITTTVNFSGMTSKANHIYDKTKSLITVAHQSANLPTVNDLYQYNSNQDVIFKLHKEGDPLRQFDYQGVLLLKDSSANRYSTQKTYYSYYEYNSKGQLTRLRDFYGGDKLSREDIYSYESNVVTVKGKSYASFAGGNVSEYEKKNYYDKKGSLIKSTFTQNSKTETTEYKLDDNGNWIWKTGGMTRRIEYYETAPATNKATSGSDKNNNQLPLLLEENFENNNNKWAVWDNEGSAAQLVNGNYRVTIKDNKNYACWLKSVPDMADQSIDFAIETKIFLHSTDAGNSYDSYWLLWGVGNNGKDFYTLGIYPSGKFQYGKQVNGQWDGKAGSITSTAVNAGVNKANVLRVEKRKNEIFFFVNGIEVYKTKYETFDKNYTGVGFQWNNKKLLDIDYLKIWRGTVSNVAQSPEPHESNYQMKLADAANSIDRANALIDYYLAVKPLTPATEQLESLIGQKFLQMMDIDYHGFYLLLMSRRINADDIKLCMKASAVLTSEQRSAVKLIAQYTVDEFQATQNNTTKPAYPRGVPQPGYGWGKTVSSNKTTASVSTANKPVVPNPVQPTPAYIPAEAKALIDRSFYKDSSYTDLWGGFHSISVIYSVESIDGNYANVLYFLSNNSLIKNGRLPWSVLTQYSSKYKPLEKKYGICGTCNGIGTIQSKSTSSHTNDYEYTLGVKKTYTTTTTSIIACTRCYGAGICTSDGTANEWPQPYYQKKKK